MDIVANMPANDAHRPVRPRGRNAVAARIKSLLLRQRSAASGVNSVFDDFVRVPAGCAAESRDVRQYEHQGRRLIKS